VPERAASEFEIDVEPRAEIGRSEDWSDKGTVLYPDSMIRWQQKRGQFAMSGPAASFDINVSFFVSFYRRPTQSGNWFHVSIDRGT
jgi:hypothetical protein